MKVGDVTEMASRHSGIRLRTVREGGYEYAYLVKRKPVTRAVLNYASLEEDVPLAFVKYVEARFDIRFGERDPVAV